MSLGKKILIVAGVLFGSLIVAAAVLPFLFKDRIAARAHAAIDAAVDARVAWGGVGLSVLRDFPDVTFSLDDLTVVGIDRFAGDTLVAMDGFGLVLDLGSLLGAWRHGTPVRVRSVRIEGPDVHLIVLDDGTANWDVAHSGGPPSGAAAPSSRAFGVELRGLAVTDGRVVLENRQTGLFASVIGLRHELSGDFAKEHLVARSSTHADTTTVRFAGVPYLDRVALDFDADVDADMANRRFTFRDNELRLNDLALAFSGTADASGDDLALDVTFEAPRTEFAHILSLVPAVYAHDFQALETSGSFAVRGRVQGAMGERSFPAFSVAAEVKDGMFHYPDLPLPARDISLDLAIDNPGGDVDSTVVRLDRFHMALGNEPVDASMTLRTPVSDPDVDFRVKGTLDLADVPRTVKLEKVEELSGVVAADAAVRARMSDVDAARWDRIAASGTVSAKDVTVRSAALPQPVSVQEATLGLSPQRAELRSLRAQLGSSDLSATGSVDNILGYVLRDEVLRGHATLTSQRFDLAEWKSKDSQLEVIPVPAGVDLTLEATVTRLDYGPMQMADARGSLHVKDERVTLDHFTMGMLGGRVGVDGFYETTEPARPTFGVTLDLDSLDISRAAETLSTVSALAPVARFARGVFTAKLDLGGALGPDMKPLFPVLTGKGSLLTSKLTLENFPPLARVAQLLSLPQLDNPTFEAIRSSIEIREGRLHVRPFTVRVGNLRMGVAGSNGVDQSLDYQLSLAVPRAALGSAAAKVVSDLVSKAGRVGVDLQAADSVDLAIGLTGTVTSPSVQADLGGLVTSAGDQVKTAAGVAAQERIDSAEARVDSARARALRDAQARADSIVAEAERRAEQIRAEAKKLADDVRAEGNRRADQVLAEAKNPIAQAAAKPVAARIRKEAEDKATGIEKQADDRATAMVGEARKEADAILAAAGG